MRLPEMVLGAPVLASAHGAGLMTQVRPPQTDARLAEAVPEDVSLFISQRRKFIDEYWAEVVEALGTSGFPAARRGG